MLSDNCQSVNKVLLDAELLSPDTEPKIKRTTLKTYVKVCRITETGTVIQRLFVTPLMHSQSSDSLATNGPRIGDGRDF